MFNKSLVSPGHIHDQILRFLHLMVVNNRGESGSDPLPQAEDRALLPGKSRERFLNIYVYIQQISVELK